jgi:glycosyltransferase involved in cell wall biosynthesis
MLEVGITADVCCVQFTRGISNGKQRHVTTIVHVIGTLEIGGAQMMMWKLLSRMDSQRFRNVVVCAFEEGPFAERLRAIGVPVHCLGMRQGTRPPGMVRRLTRLAKSPFAAARLVRLLRRVEPDVVITWGYHVDLLGLLGGRLVGVPVVWTIFSSFNPFLGRFVTAVNMLAVRLSGLPAMVVTDSEAGRDWHKQLGYRPKAWRVIPNGFDIAQFAPDAAARREMREELGLPPDALLIGLIARFNPVKGHLTFLEAARQARQDGIDAHFVMVGPGVTISNDALREPIETSGLRERVHLLGERSDIPRLTAALDIATCASYAESFPNVVGEAMACAVPCVVTDVGDAARMVGDTGLVVPPRDAPAMAAAWGQLTALAPEQRQELGRRARARVEAHFSLDFVVRQYEELAERLATSHSGGAARSRPPA